MPVTTVNNGVGVVGIGKWVVEGAVVGGCRVRSARVLVWDEEWEERSDGISTSNINSYIKRTRKKLTYGKKQHALILQK